MKICVFMSDNRPLSSNLENAEYNSYVAAINSEYCKKYKYDFLYYQPYLYNKEPLSIHNCIDPNTGDTRHASWSKLLSTQKALELDYDYVVYIDSDCIFKNFNIPLEKYINQYPEKDLIFFSNKPWSEDEPCAGFFICKVSDSSKEIVKNWYNYSVPNHNKYHMYEQNALWETYKTLNIAIIKETMFDEVDGQFLRHIGINVHYQRIPYFKDFIFFYKIPLNTNLTTIQFDTSKM